MKVINRNAKIEYTYDRFEYATMSKSELKDSLYANAVYNAKSRHNRVEMIGNKNGKGITYYNICCGFDCETYTDKDKQLSYMYIWQFSINKAVVRGRTYEELLNFLQDIREILQPKENHRLLVFIHNMSYESSFFLKWFNCEKRGDNFFKEQREPIKITHDGFIEFRDSMILCGGDSLAGLAKNYCNTQKCKGDLDYNIPRNRYTELTEEENGYCDNDVLILSEYARYVFDHIMNEYHKLPLTQTGLLTNECKYKLGELYKNPQVFHDYNVKRSAPDELTYKIHSNYLYRGGYTHACVDIVEQELTDLMGVDITSSYPYVMCQPVYVDAWEKVSGATVEMIESDFANGLLGLFIAEFNGIKSTGIHSIESKSKCLELSPNAVIDNGRVYYADSMKVYLTSFDFENYKHFYTWDSVTVSCYQRGKRRHLYKHIVVPMLKYYKQKAILKAQGEPYAIPKARVNTFYGLSVKRLNGEFTTYDNGGFGLDDAKPYEEQVKSSITCFYDGVMISAFARYRLLTLAYDVYTKFGIKSVYMDTDSHKFMNPTPELIQYLEDLNKQIREENKANIEYYTEYSEEYADLGEWDIEFYPWSMYDPNSKKAYIKRFKSLGAKRYIIECDEWNKNKKTRERTLHQTVAGLPKGEMLKQYGTIDNCFDKFSDKMVITGCKLYSHYVDEPYEITVTDEQGNTDTQYNYSCNALLPSDFSLTIDEIWKMFYTNIALSNEQTNRETRII